MSSGEWSIDDRRVFPAGTLIGVYRIEEPIGEGGMGMVYRALDTKLNRLVAIKFLSEDLADATARRRFQQEARTASSLNHPHILTVHDAGEFEGRQYIVTEFVDGGTLKDWAKAEKRTWRQCVELLTGVADGLAAAHNAGILHRDIKPANILVARNGYAKLADFGLAKLNGDAPDETVTRTGMVVGTLAYMSPEQVSGKQIDARSDVFSFGVVLYEMLAGRRPFAGESHLETMQAVAHTEPAPLNPELPESLRAVVAKALEKEPAERYQSMRELVVDLRRLGRQPELGSSAARRSLRPVWAAAILLLLVAIAAAGWKMWPRPPSEFHLAVLPVVSVAGAADAEQEYFTDGFTEALISTFGRIHSIRTTSRTSIMRYKNSEKSMREIALELGVDGILESTVRRSGNRVRIDARLIEAATDTSLWSGEYEREIADILQLQAEVAEAVAREIEAEVTPEETRLLAAAPSVNPAAYEAYLAGRYYLYRGNPADRRESLVHFEQAIRRQPDYAEAYASLSLAWHLLRAGGASAAEAYEPAREAAEAALRYDPDNALAYITLAGVKWFEEWDWDAAEAGYQRARALDPSSMDLCFCYTLFLYSVGRPDDAIAIARRGIETDPLNSNAQGNLGQALYAARRYEDALGPFMRAFELNPGSLQNRVSIAKIYRQLGRLDDALAILDAPDLRPSAALAWVYGLMGRREEAVRMLESLDGMQDRLAIINQTPGDMYTTAAAYFALGDMDTGLRLVRQSLDARQAGISFMKYDAMFDDVRGDPRFQSLMAELKLPN